MNLYNVEEVNNIGYVRIVRNTFLLALVLFALTCWLSPGVMANVTFEAKLTAYDGGTNDYFGWLLDVDDDTIVVGARNTGVSYVFTRSGATWSLEADLHHMGYPDAVAVDGDFVVIGSAPGNGAYPYERVGTTWSRGPLLQRVDPP